MRTLRLGLEQSDDDVRDSITAQVLRVQRGDEAALRRLVTDHLPWIAAHVKNRMSPLAPRDGDTEDFVQAVLLDVLRDGPHLPKLAEKLDLLRRGAVRDALTEG